MNPALVLTFYILFVMLIVALHELLHYVPMKVLGYRVRYTRNKIGIGFYLPDNEIKKKWHAVVIQLLPQVVTVTLLYFSLTTTGLISFILEICTVGIFLASIWDIYDLARFLLKIKN